MNKDFDNHSIEYCILKNFDPKDSKKYLKELPTSIKVTFDLHK